MDSLLSGFLTSYCVRASLDVVQNEASTQKVDNLLDINCYLSKCRHWRKNTTLNTWLQRKFYSRWRILSSACHMFIFRLFTIVLNEIVIDCYCDLEVIMRLMCTQKNKSRTFTKMSCVSFWWYFFNWNNKNTDGNLTFAAHCRMYWGSIAGPKGPRNMN